MVNGTINCTASYLPVRVALIILELRSGTALGLLGGSRGRLLVRVVVVVDEACASLQLSSHLKRECDVTTNFGMEDERVDTSNWHV